MTYSVTCASSTSIFFFFNDTATTEIYTLSLHDALPIYFAYPAIWKPRDGAGSQGLRSVSAGGLRGIPCGGNTTQSDRKSTRLNSSHANISYAVFCLKKNKSKSIGRRCRR